MYRYIHVSILKCVCGLLGLTRSLLSASLWLQTYRSFPWKQKVFSKGRSQYVRDTHCPFIADCST